MKEIESSMTYSCVFAISRLFSGILNVASGIVGFNGLQYAAIDFRKTVKNPVPGGKEGAFPRPLTLLPGGPQETSKVLRREFFLVTVEVEVVHFGIIAVVLDKHEDVLVVGM